LQGKKVYLDIYMKKKLIDNQPIFLSDL